MWHRLTPTCHAVNTFAAQNARRSFQQRSHVNVTPILVRCHLRVLRGLRPAGCRLSHRHLASGREDKGDSTQVSRSTAACEDTAKSVIRESSEVAARSTDEASSSTSVVSRASNETSVARRPVVAESIEDILIRTRRKELIQRVGPQVERYMPTEDPNALLLPDSRLDPGERWWQKVFVALPWAVFAAMLATPFLLVSVNLPWLQKRAEQFRSSQPERGEDEVPRHLPEFQVVNFGQMPDVVERPFPTILMLAEPSTFASKIFLAVFHDLARLLRESGIAVSVAVLDVSASPRPPSEFLWDYPPPLGPHVQLVLPRARDGEAGIVDYDGRWSASAFAEVARRLAGPYSPAVPEEELVQLESQTGKLRDLMFELLFLEGCVQSSVDPKESPATRSWYSYLFRARAPHDERIERQEAFEDIESILDFTAGTAAAISSCENAFRQLHDARQQQRSG